MEPKFKSSKSRTNFQKYSPYFFFIALVSLIYIFRDTPYNGNKIFFIGIFFVIFIIIAIETWKIKYIEVFDDKLVVDENYGKKDVQYKDIISIKQSIGNKIVFVDINYFDTSDGKNKKIKVIPDAPFNERFFKSSFSDYEMTRFLKERCRAVNPNFKPEGNLEKIIFSLVWIPVFIIALLAIMFIFRSSGI